MIPRYAIVKDEGTKEVYCTRRMLAWSVARFHECTLNTHAHLVF